MAVCRKSSKLFQVNMFDANKFVGDVGTNINQHVLQVVGGVSLASLVKVFISTYLSCFNTLSIAAA